MIFGMAERLSLFDVIAQVTRSDMALSEEESEEEEGEEIFHLGATSTSSRVKCKYCNVHFCLEELNCFYDYHTKVYWRQ